jgi:hypothetical protein
MGNYNSEVGTAMHSKQLLERLIEIERAIGVEEPLTVREMVMEAQEYLLELQRNAVRGNYFESLSPL